MALETPVVVELFDSIAPVYDALNRVISWGYDQVWRRELAQRMLLEPDQVVLDISAGTGDMQTALQGVCSDITVIGLDPSAKMLKLYRAKTPQSLVMRGVAEEVSLKNSSVDRMVCSFGLRNFRDRKQAYMEIQRILKSGGLWGFLEMSAPTGCLFPKIYSLYFKRLVPLIGAVYSRHPFAYRYLRDSVYQFPGYDVMTAEHRTAGFTLVSYRPILKGAVGLYVFRKKITDNSGEKPTGG